MKAAIYTVYGPPDVLQISEVDKPQPKNDEVLIHVHATTVNRTDTGLRSARYFISRFFTGLIKPKRPIGGSEFAGEIVAVGEDVDTYNIGDKVFGFDDVYGGAHAEFVTKESNGPLTTIPEGFTYNVVVAAGEGATYALNDIRAAKVQNGQKVMVYGASGAIGSAAVQLLKYMGADVTAVCGTKNVKLIKSLGADRVIDHQTQDYRQTDDRYDFIFDAVGKISYRACKRLLNQNGTYCSTELGNYGQNPLFAIWFAVTRSRKVIFPIPKINKENMEYIKKVVEAGAFKPLIDCTYHLEDIVEATKYVESEQKVGSVVIKIYTPQYV